MEGKKFYQVNGISLHVKDFGKDADPIIIFLHGFPEFWYGWRNQVYFFVENGFRVILPDLRGYNLSTKPGNVIDYKIENAADDIVALIHQLSHQKIFLVGHDWGGVVAWHLAIKNPQLIQKIVVINIPHPKVAFYYMVKNPRQMLRSWYIGFFQLPVIPEMICSFFNFKILKNTMLNTSLKGTFSKEDLKKYEQAWKQPGAIKAMINWYRGIKYSKISGDNISKVPTRIIWGKKDNFLSYKMAPPSLKYCRQGKINFIEEGTHWVHLEKPKVVNEIINNFFKATDAVDENS